MPIKDFLYDPRRKVQVNPERLAYLADLFCMKQEEVCEMVQGRRKTPVKPEDLFGREIRASHLRALQKIFRKDPGFFVSDEDLAASREASILFRKKSPNCDLRYADRLLITSMEAESLHLSAMSGLLRKRLKRKLRKHSLRESAGEAAYRIREELGVRPKPYKDERKHLKYLIALLADKDIVVYEDVGRSKEESNLAGFYLAPHTIVIKREKPIRREMFTLAHELGHYLLDSEDMDQSPLREENSAEERWCNEFAFHFLMGREGLSGLSAVTMRDLNDPFGKIAELAKERQVSRLAILCHFARQGKFEWKRFYGVKAKIAKKEEEEELERKRLAELSRAEERPFFSPSRPIFSPLDKKIYIDAFHAGIVEEHNLVQKFKTRSIDAVLYGER